MNSSRLLEAESLLAVADLGGFGAAARELGVAQSTISRRVAALEARVGHSLIERTTRRIALTDEGITLAADLRDVLARLDQAENRLHAGAAEPQGVLSITMPTAYGRARVIPHLAALAKTYPRLRFRIDLSDRYVDVLDGGFDIALRFSQTSVSGVQVEKLASFGVTLCASPQYLATAGAPGTPHELAGRACLVQQVYAPRASWPMQWRGQTVEVAIDPHIIASDMTAIAQLTIAGCGIAVLPSYLIETELAAGMLVRLLPDAKLPEFDVYAAYPRQKARLGKVTAALAVLSSALSSG